MQAQTAAPAPAPADASELEFFKLEDTLNQQTQVASTKGHSLRESPGIITVISHDEIINSGARDLLDVLQLVPGFHITFGGQGIAAISVRGVPSGVLVLIDGVQQNDIEFATLQLGNRYPVDQIQSIEIIRGPGSAEYGGYAEQAVISIHTRSTKDLKGMSVSGTWGQYPKGLAQQDLSLYAGVGTDDPKGPQATFTGLVGKGNRSDQIYVDQFGQTLNLADNSALTPGFLNFGASYHDFSARVIYDDYEVGSKDGINAFGIPPPVDTQRFQSFYAGVQWDGQITDKFKIVPRISVLEQMPYDAPPSNLKIIRSTANVIGSYSFIDNMDQWWMHDLSLSVGLQGYYDHAKSLGDNTVPPFAGGTSTTANYQNGAVFGELSYGSIIGNLVIGARYEDNSQTGGYFVPRFGLTKKIDHFHFKLLASESFRAPGIEELSLASSGLEPEHTWVEEAEIGYQIGDHSFISVNAYNLTTYGFIIYDFATNQYNNGPQIGAKGVEADWKLQYSWGSLDVNYSFYTADGSIQVPVFEVAGHPNQTAGMPQHKFTAHGNFKLWRGLSFNPSLVYISERWTYPFADPTTGAGVVGAIPDTTLLNAYFLYKDLGVNGLDLGAGGYNLLNQTNMLPQPGNFGHAPYPGGRRDLFVRVTYTLPF